MLEREVGSEALYTMRHFNRKSLSAAIAPGRRRIAEKPNVLNLGFLGIPKIVCKTAPA